MNECIQQPCIMPSGIRIKKLNSYKKDDLLWTLVCSQLPFEGEQQKISGWKRFYQEVTKNGQKPIHGIHYLPAINQSPTKFNTVQKMFLQAKASTLGFLATYLVLYLIKQST